MKAQAIEVKVELGGRSYSALVGRGVLGMAKAVVEHNRGLGNRNVLVVEKVADKLWGDYIRTALSILPGDTIVVAGGEAAKTWQRAEELLRQWIELGLGRKDWVWVAGGGATLDLVGFAAAVFQRGISWANIPTTFLAATDSCLGGKTAVNLGNLKNYAGAFHQPRVVFCETELLESLTPRQRSEGLAEVIKCGAIGNVALLGYLEPRLPDLRSGKLIPEAALAGALAVKAKLVGEDERDEGVRRHLNFGHTIAHVLERLCQPVPSHGAAVAQGMLVEGRLALELGMITRDELDYLAKLVAELKLPAIVLPEIKDALPLLSRDKKRTGSGIPFALPSPLGAAQVVEVEEKVIAKLWAKV
jgi:3-dehydroquinate synthase